ncbi:O-antigen ligase family protein [Dactylosporangium siamense]|uniref:O-antigen ligase family protein n=1 Tax=Dactylosporangium siamense TaxID=685454 RepID=UPI001940A60C|nr:O-antigen ligase family protein [Dactylosporangium siamense]
MFVLSEMSPARRITLLAAVPLLVLSSSGLTAELMFDRTSALKYALTVGAAMIAIAAALAPQPLLVFVALLVVAAPVATFEVDLVGVRVSAVVALLMLTAVPVFLGLGKRVGPTALGRAGCFAAVLIAVPIAAGPDISEALYVPAVIAVVAFYCARASVLPGGTSVVLISSLISLMTQAALAVWEYATGQQINLYGGAEARAAGYFFDFQTQPRPTGTFFDPISLGTVLAPVLPLGVAAVLLLVHHRRRLAAMATASAVILVGCGLSLTLSRMPSIGALVGIATVLVLVPRRLRWPAVAQTGAVLGVLVAMAVSVGGPSLLLRATSVTDPTANGVVTADGDRDRVGFWHVALEAGFDHPLAGVGVGHLNQLLVARAPDANVYTHAHSTYLQIFAECGVLGLAAIAIIGAGFLRDLARVWRRSPVLAAGLAGAATAVSVAALTDVVVIRYVAVAAALAPLLGLVAGLASRQSADG